MAPQSDALFGFKSDTWHTTIREADVDSAHRPDCCMQALQKCYISHMKLAMIDCAGHGIANVRQAVFVMNHPACATEVSNEQTSAQTKIGHALVLVSPD